MGNSDLILKVVAVISFVMALEVSSISRAVSVLLLTSAVLGFAVSSASETVDSFMESRTALAPWILSAAAVLSVGDTSLAAVLGVIGAWGVGASLMHWRAYTRLVPAVGLPMVVSVIAAEGEIGLGVVGWLVVVADFALLTNHLQFEATPRSLDRRQPGLVHRPHRALQSVALVGVCVICAALAAPMVGTPAVNFDSGLGSSPFGGDLGGPALAAHPGLKGQLDTGRRVDLGNEIVLRVKADRPDYWRGTTYTSWDGRFWSNPDRGTRYTWPSEGVTLSAGQPGGKTSNQYFTLERSGLDVILGAYKIEALWSTQRAGLVGDDGSLTLDEPLGAGARWTVRSSVRDVTPEKLRNADPLTLGISTGVRNQFATESDVTPRVAELARQITENEPTTYDKVKALEAWIDNNIKYSREIADLPPGADAVEQLLLVDQVGYCEQIGTSLVVMLRSLGIPARLVVGYIPGEFDDSTGEWISRADDAHAWAEVFFPGMGWQGFDPTSGVPLAGDVLEEPTTQGSTYAPDWNLILQILVGSALLFIVASIGKRLLGQRGDRVNRRMGSVDALGSRLQRDWSQAMTIREKLNDLSSLGIDPDLTSRVAQGLEQVSYSSKDPTQTQDRHLVLDEDLNELGDAVDQLLKVPT